MWVFKILSKDENLPQYVGVFVDGKENVKAAYNQDSAGNYIGALRKGATYILDTRKVAKPMKEMHDYRISGTFVLNQNAPVENPMENAELRVTLIEEIDLVTY